MIFKQLSISKADQCWMLSTFIGPMTRQMRIILILTLVSFQSLFGQNLEKYASQVIFLDSLYPIILNQDSTEALNRLNALYHKNTEYSHEGFDLLVQILILNYRIDKNYMTEEMRELILRTIVKAQGVTTKEILADAFQMAAKYYWNQKSYAKALEYYLNSNHIYKDYGLSQFPRKCEYLNELASKFYYFNDFSTARMYYLQFWDIIPKDKKRNVTSTLNTLGLCYSNLQMYDSSEYFFNMAEELARHFKEEVWLGIISGNKANIYYQQGKLDQALPLFEKDAEISISKNSNLSAALSLATCASIYLSRNLKDTALQVILEAIDLIHNKIDKNNILVKAKVFPIVAKIYAEHGMTREAYLYLDSANIAKDTLTKQKNLLYLMGARNKFEAGKHLDELKQKESEVNKQKLIRNMLIAGLIFLLFFAVVFFVQRNYIKKEKLRTDELLCNILPAEVAEELKAKGSAEARQYEEVTVMFTDFEDFTIISEHLSPKQLVADIHSYFEAFDKIISKYKIEKIKTIGDSYMCAGGLPVANSTHALDVVHAAWELQDYMNRCKKDGKSLYNIRIGIHTGPVVAGIVGVMKFAYDIWGDTVNTASRLETAGEAGKINISGATYVLVKDHFQCTYRGKVEAKHKGLIDMYFVEEKNV